MARTSALSRAPAGSGVPDRLPRGSAVRSKHRGQGADCTLCNCGGRFSHCVATDYATKPQRLGTDHGEPSAEALTKARTVADDYEAAYEEWLVNLAAENAGPSPQIPEVRFSELTRGFGVD